MNIGLIFQLLFLFLLPVGLIFFQIGDSLTHGVKTGEWMPFADKTVGRLLASGEITIEALPEGGYDLTKIVNKKIKAH